MKIFVMPTSYPNEDNPVANSFVKEQVKAISKKNDDIVVLNVQKQPTSRLFKKLDKNIFPLNDGVLEVVCKKQKTFFESKFVFLNQFLFDRAMKKVYKYAVGKYGKPDIIYAHFCSAGYTALKLTKKDNIPVVVLEHSGALMSDKLDYRVKHILKNAVENSERYIVTTSRLGEFVKKHTGTKKDLPVIPNVVDDIFVYAPPIEKERFTFFSVSRFDYDKRLDLLVEAFCEAFLPNEPVDLIIGGSGKENDNLLKLISSKNRQGQVKLIGRLDRTEVLNNMEKCNCFVLPSRHETFGLVWREAMCVGRPVVTTDHGGFSSEDWNESFGIMVPVDDKKGLSEALVDMKNNYSKYDLRNISEENRAMYSSDKISKRLLRMFQDLSGEDNE